MVFYFLSVILSGKCITPAINQRAQLLLVLIMFEPAALLPRDALQEVFLA